MAETGWREWLDRLRAEGRLPAAGQTLDAMRDALKRGADAIEGPAPPLADIRAVTIPGPAGASPGRLYTPYAAGGPPGSVLVFFHGGGFVIGDLDTHDRLCRRLAATSHVRVLSASYRLAPAHPFPAAVDDALAAFDWVAGAGADALGLDPLRIAVGGDSAGGNLAAVVAQERRKTSLRGGVEGRAPIFQLLIYPLMQLVESNAKRAKVLEGHLMSAAILDGVRERYLGPDGDPRDPRASPLFATDLSRLCPAYVITSGLDPLQHEARAYADLLAAAGVAVKLAHYPSTPHGFLQLTSVLDVAHEAIDAAGEALARALASNTTTA